MGAGARDATPQVTALLHRDSDRPFALEALKKMEVRSVPHLIEALGIQNPEVRIFACDRLAAIAPDSRDAVPAIRGLLEGQPDEVQRAARRALKKF